MCHRAGLSRREAVVGLLIVAFAMGLILPAIARVRETAALTSCGNNQKQLGIAVHNYASASQDRLPHLTDQGDGAPTGKGLPSMFATLGVYLEAGAFTFAPRKTPDEYHAPSSASFRAPDSEGANHILTGGYVNRTWQVYVCPADATARDRYQNEAYTLPDGTTHYHVGLRDVSMTLPDGTTGYYATGSYAANGMFPWGRGKIDEIPRGTSNVMMFAERPQVCRTAAGEDVFNLWGVGFYSPHMPAFATLTPTEPAGLWSTGQIAQVTPLPDENATDRDAQIRVRIGRADAAPEAPDFTLPIQRIRKGKPCDPRLPGTPHRAGMQVAMADGSVRVFAPDTTPWVFWTACYPGKSTTLPQP